MSTGPKYHVIRLVTDVGLMGGQKAISAWRTPLFAPYYHQSVIVMSGDSGHGFKMFPIVGSWVVDLLGSEGGRQQEARWRWKSQAANGNGSADWGEKVSWRVGETREFSEIEQAQPKL